MSFSFHILYYKVFQILYVLKSGKNCSPKEVTLWSVSLTSYSVIPFPTSPAATLVLLVPFLKITVSGI